MKFAVLVIATLILAACTSASASDETFKDLSGRYKSGVVFAPSYSADGSSTDVTQGVTFSKTRLGNGGVSQETNTSTKSSSDNSSSQVTQQSTPTQGDTSKDASQSNPTQTDSSKDVSQSNPSSSGDVTQGSGSHGNSTTPPVLKGDCNLTGDYINGTDVRKCETILIDSLRVPAGVTLNLTKLTDGAEISFQGTTTFGTTLWDGPLIKLQGNNLSVTGPGTLDGQGAWYWPQGQDVDKPVFFKLNRVVNSTLSGFSLLNMPYRTFSVGNSQYTTISHLLLNSTAGDGLAKNTDGFDLSNNDHITITNCTIYNQDDCLAMQSSTNTVFSNNYCHGSHGISIGSLGGPERNSSTTVRGLNVTGNIIVNSTNGIRIKTIIGLKGLVTDAVYTNNELVNVTHAIVVHSDYNKTKGGYARTPTSLVEITNITIDGLTGTAENLFDIVANPDVVSNWTFKHIDVLSTSLGNCTGEPASITC